MTGCIIRIVSGGGIRAGFVVGDHADIIARYAGVGQGSGSAFSLCVVVESSNYCFHVCLLRQGMENVFLVRKATAGGCNRHRIQIVERWVLQSVVASNLHAMDASERIIVPQIEISHV